jgi:hypothetical protein
MSDRRVARRVALRSERENARCSAVTTRNVETKVLHSCLPSFPGRGRVDSGFVVGVEGRRPCTGRFRSGSCPAGVWSLLSPNDARRVAWMLALAPTPFLTSALATKQREVKVRK